MHGTVQAHDRDPAAELHRASGEQLDVEHCVGLEQLIIPLAAVERLVGEQDQNGHLDGQPLVDLTMPGEDRAQPAGRHAEGLPRTPERVQRPLALCLVGERLPVMVHAGDAERAPGIQVAQRGEQTLHGCARGGVPGQLQPGAVEDQG
ncbi:hypothetical protein GCM10027061_09000 [Nesterenkonia suensis]